MNGRKNEDAWVRAFEALLRTGMSPYNVGRLSHVYNIHNDEGILDPENGDSMLPNPTQFSLTIKYMQKMGVLNTELNEDAALFELYGALCHVEGRLSITRRIIHAIDNDEVRAAVEDEIRGLGPVEGMGYGGLYYENAVDMVRKLNILARMRAPREVFLRLLHMYDWKRSGTTTVRAAAKAEDEDRIFAANGLKGGGGDIVSLAFRPGNLITGEDPTTFFKE